ncbi:CAP domain-containing protein [Streptomyces acidiscabies]|uniref:CAP domain-containing protein n=1 Tax=Streptomyces acidiscabies TaxID=42234 RepID=UPI00073F0166|nr:CAP domain-containing protein [Streptomyces acidiscabies]GAQ54319.1 cysteine-rich secretory protein family protein [Streptomyces acidiscabies]
MGRHRRAAAGRAETGHTHEQDHTPGMGMPPSVDPEAYADANALSSDYLYATDSAAEAATTGPHRRRKKHPVRTGLLGVSAAVALGAVAVTSGIVPGLESYKLGGDSASDASGDRVRASDSPTNAASEQGGAAGTADSGAGTAPRASAPSASPSLAPKTSPAPEKEKKAPAKKAAEAKPSASPSKAAETPVQEKQTEAPAAKAPAKAATAVSAELQAAAQVLVLVNEERAKVGCSALSANSALADLAQKFSEDMAARGFFDHTDPDGKSPWDRAAAAGITDLAGENIARGQGDAAAVMDAWMNSPGHKANILNCDFKTLGVGVHFGSGGPWWTQDFGY